MRIVIRYDNFKEKAEESLDSAITLMKCSSMLEKSYGDYPSVKNSSSVNYADYFTLLWDLNRKTNPFKKANVLVVGGVASSAAEKKAFPKSTECELKDSWPLHIQLVRRSAVSSGLILFQNKVKIMCEATTGSR